MNAHDPAIYRQLIASLTADQTTLGQRIRLARLAAGLSQRELGELCGRGVSYAYISRCEADNRSPSVKALRKIAAGTGVTVAWLETGSDLVYVRMPRETADRLFDLFEELAFEHGELWDTPLRVFAAALGRDLSHVVGVA